MHEELTALRRARAEELLKETDLPIGSIASQVGYGDAAVFSRAFRRWAGIAPSEFRRCARDTGE